MNIRAEGCESARASGYKSDRMQESELMTVQEYEGARHGSAREQDYKSARA